MSTVTKTLLNGVDTDTVGAGQLVHGETTVCAMGGLDGGRIYVEYSIDDVVYVPINNWDMRYGQVWKFPFTGDYYLRALLLGSRGSANCTVIATYVEEVQSPLPVIVVTI